MHQHNGKRKVSAFSYFVRRGGLWFGCVFVWVGAFLLFVRLVWGLFGRGFLVLLGGLFWCCVRFFGFVCF